MDKNTFEAFKKEINESAYDKIIVEKTKKKEEGEISITIFKKNEFKMNFILDENKKIAALYYKTGDISFPWSLHVKNANTEVKKMCEYLLESIIQVFHLRLKLLLT